MSVPVTGEEGNPGVKEMEAMILECAKMDREIDVFVNIVERVTAEVRARRRGNERLGSEARLGGEWTSWKVTRILFSSGKSSCAAVSFKCQGNTEVD